MRNQANEPGCEMAVALTKRHLLAWTAVLLFSGIDAQTSSGQSIGVSSSEHGGGQAAFSNVVATSVKQLYGLDFSPYISGQDPNLNPQVSPEQITARLSVVAPYIGWVRTFSVTSGLEKVPQIAHSMNLKVAGGAWISKDSAQNTAEINSLITLANAGAIDMAIVGSEVLLRGDLSEAQLIAYIKQVRQAIPTNIPVTTADSYGTLIAHPNVIQASDVVAANFYPYWEKQSAATAVCSLIDQYQKLVVMASGKSVIVSETGWPSSGSAQGAAVPSPQNAGQYALQFVSWARSNNIPFFYFEAFDEAWKANYEGPQGAAWGVWDQTGAVKPSMQPFLSGDVSQAVCNGVPGGTGTPQISLTYVPPMGSVDRLEGQALHISVSNYAVAVYINVSGLWWPKPTYAQPVTPIQSDGSWAATIVSGGNDELASSIAAFLIPKSYNPPVFSGSPTLPAALNQIAIASIQTARSSLAISGQVVDRAGLPLVGIPVVIAGSSSATTNTAPDGLYSFPNLPSPGPYTVTPLSAQQIFSPASSSFSTIRSPQTANFTLSSVAAGGLRFIPVTPCRLVDTRNSTGPFGGPMIDAGGTRSFNLYNSSCGIPSAAKAFALNVTVVPSGPLRWITVWPSGEPQPAVSTLNSFDGRIKANAAIIPAGANGAVSVFSTDLSHVILDVTGYFTDASDTTAMAFYPLPPCRVADTRAPAGLLGGPLMHARETRDFPVLLSNCAIPNVAKAYAVNLTAVPKGPLAWLTAWPAGHQIPSVSALNAPTGTVVANGAILPSGTNGDVSIFVTNDTDVIIDVTGYFAPASQGGLSLYNVVPCRVLDTRLSNGTPPSGLQVVNVAGSTCDVPTAPAYVFNLTAVPPASLGYVTLWAAGNPEPNVSTLNGYDGAVTSNLAISPAAKGLTSAFSSSPTHLILDVFGYFAP